MQEFLEDIIKQAGELTLEYRKRLSTVRVDRKSAKDLVTEADVAVEKLITAAIKNKYPAHSILGEETGLTKGDDSRWIIDPIDGTVSFVHQQPFYSVSIALERNGVITNAAVYAPVLGELFTAVKGGGAFLNGKAIKVSRCDVLGDSLLATGFACIRSGLAENNLPIFTKMMPLIREVRRYGSAAIDCCYVACGRLEGFWEYNLNIYDVAAGRLIVEEAGGKFSDFNETDSKLYSQVLATNGILHSQICGVIQSARNSR
jgi:myo-inositol-1(or 4)-monophosphatase